jgi:hypothetical protein
VAEEMFGAGPPPRRDTPRAGPETAGLFSRPELEAEARLEAARLTRLRQFRGRGEGALQDVLAQLGRAARWWTTLRFKGTGSPKLLSIFLAELVDGRGLLVEQRIIPVVADLRLAPASLRHIVLAQLGDAALDAAREMLSAVRSAVLPRLEAERAREAALGAVVDAVPLVAVQAGLFDRRALREADAARERRAVLEEETGRRLDDLRRAAGIGLARPPRPVLVALLRGA